MSCATRVSSEALPGMIFPTRGRDRPDDAIRGEEHDVAGANCRAPCLEPMRMRRPLAQGRLAAEEAQVVLTCLGFRVHCGQREPSRGGGDTSMTGGGVFARLRRRAAGPLLTAA